MRDIEEPPVRVYLVWSNEHDAWWKPKRCGYTDDVWQAGRYDEADAAACCGNHSWRNGKPPEVMIPAPENDQGKFSVDDLRDMPARMASRVQEATAAAIAERRAAEQGGEVT